MSAVLFKSIVCAAALEAGTSAENGSVTVAVELDPVFLASVTDDDLTSLEAALTVGVFEANPETGAMVSKQSGGLTSLKHMNGSQGRWWVGECQLGGVGAGTFEFFVVTGLASDVELDDGSTIEATEVSPCVASVLCTVLP